MRRPRPSALLAPPLAAPPPAIPPRRLPEVERQNARWFNQRLEEIGALSPTYPWLQDEEEEEEEVLDIYVQAPAPARPEKRKRVVYVVADLGRDDCAVCLHALIGTKEDQKALAVVECGHVFHEACIQDVKDSRCPLCRFETSVPREGAEKRRRTS